MVLEGLKQCELWCKQHWVPNPGSTLSIWSWVHVEAASGLPSAGEESMWQDADLCYLQGNHMGLLVPGILGGFWVLVLGYLGF